jgi:hypothetical protein
MLHRSTSVLFGDFSDTDGTRTPTPALECTRGAVHD